MYIAIRVSHNPWAGTAVPSLAICDPALRLGDSRECMDTVYGFWGYLRWGYLRCVYGVYTAQVGYLPMWKKVSPRT